ncbi:MAG: peptidase dimerization domain-containing protein [Chitinophagales bacterium]
MYSLAVEDIQWIKNFQFDKQDEYLGPIKMTVTMIEAGYQHNVVPDECKYVIDIMVDTYSYEYILLTINANVHAEINARSTRLKPSSIDKNHPIVKAAKSLGITTFDQAHCLIKPYYLFHLLKWVQKITTTPENLFLLQKLKKGIKTYIRLLNELFKNERHKTLG